MKAWPLLQIFRGTRRVSVRKVSSVKVNLDPFIEEKMKNNEIHSKRHPGAQGNVCTALPDDLKKAFDLVLTPGFKKMIAPDVEELSKYLHSRKPPMEPEAERQLVKDINQEVMNSVMEDWQHGAQEEKEYHQKNIQSKVQKIFKQRKYNWRSIEYTRHNGLMYMVCRSAREYVVNYQVLRALKNRFNYTPKTFFDFGSGVGTVLWAADSLWSGCLKEVFTVDSSTHMNELARELLKLSGRDHLKNVLFQRQFLPVSETPSYDVVMSSYSLLELPSSSARLGTVLNLWNKTNDFLVLVEFGTKAGFQVINEARDFLLWGMGKTFSRQSQQGYVVAPCSHDMPCPLAGAEKSAPCNYSATYDSYPQTNRGARKELYSYVVFRKGKKPDSEPDWPRIIRPVLVRHRHAICRMCTSRGKLTEVIFTPGKHGKLMYTCARHSKWGDRLPVSLEDIQNSENRPIMETED
ncbi:Mitochondrial small ribosomal subunit Rsm22 [Nesidiocoris tenuis]|uniref:Mitochondrial small ribosomal subunit Rsm22 n=1 Tax=Nesidiocoris tenuis TaxID=355587 RepID=A0ABN7B2X8_9HEMI|nr:Mitochondrial small ribosomal subunit Rsm22 [Nesidiocoris tenuis]